MSVNEHNSIIGSLWALNEIVFANQMLDVELCPGRILYKSSVVRVLAVLCGCYGRICRNLSVREKGEYTWIHHQEKERNLGSWMEGWGKGGGRSCFHVKQLDPLWFGLGSRGRERGRVVKPLWGHLNNYREDNVVQVILVPFSGQVCWRAYHLWVFRVDLILQMQVFVLLCFVFFWWTQLGWMSVGSEGFGLVPGVALVAPVLVCFVGF